MKMVKKFSELSKGDLIWEINSKGEVKNVLLFDSHYETNKGEKGITMNFFRGGSISIAMFTKHRMNCYNSDTFRWFESAGSYYTTKRPQDIPTEGIGFYIYNKTHNPYEMISDHFMFKDFIGYIDDEPKFDWTRKLILYKALYDCPDGPEFARHAEDFYNNFTRVL